MFNKIQILLLLILLLGCIVLNYGWVSIGDARNKDDLTHCYIGNDDGPTLKVPVGGEMTEPETCVKYMCGEDLRFTAHGCGVKGYSIEISPGDKVDWIYDKSKPYPDCCPKLLLQKKGKKPQIF